MYELTLDELGTIMRLAGGDWIPLEPDPTGADLSYADLGFDSLALLEILIRVERAAGIRVPEGAIVASNTPRDTVMYVNDMVGAA